jgi:hypothetical protein
MSTVATKKIRNKKSPIRVISSRVTSVTSKIGDTVLGTRNVDDDESFRPISARVTRIIHMDARGVETVRWQENENEEARTRELEANQLTARSCRALATLLEMPEPLPGPVIRCIDALAEELLRRKREIVAYYTEKPGSAE